MVWIGSIHCKSLCHDILLEIFALIVTVWRVLHEVSCNSETDPNPPKQKEMHQNLSLESYGVDRERSLRKIQA